MKGITQETINQLINSSRPERLSLETKPPINDHHASHIVQLTQLGLTSLAADHLLFPEINEMLCETVSAVIRQLNILFYTSRPLPEEKKRSFIGKFPSGDTLMKHCWRWLSISMASKVVGSMRKKRRVPSIDTECIKGMGKA